MLIYYLNTAGIKEIQTFTKQQRMSQSSGHNHNESLNRTFTNFRTAASNRHTRRRRVNGTGCR